MRVLSKLLVIGMLFAAVTSAMAQRRMIAHVTRSDGNFTTQIILMNTTTNEQQFVLYGYDAEGNEIGTVVDAVAAGHTVDVNANSLFESNDLSHIVIDDSSHIHVSVAYQARTGGSPAHVGESNRQAYNWRMFPGDWNAVSDGLAVVNTGENTTDVVVRQKAQDGTVLDEQVGQAALAPWAKALIVLDETFPSVPGSYFEISSADVTLAVTALRFEKPNSTFLWQNLSLEFESGPAPTYDPSVVVQWNEAILAAVRAGAPRPTVTTRSLFLFHSAIYDAWSLFDGLAQPLRLNAADRRPVAERTRANKEAAVNQAAYHMALHLFGAYQGNTSAFSRLLADLGDAPYSVSDSTPEGIGYAAAQAAIAAGQADGSNAANNYADIVTADFPAVYQASNSDDPNAENSVGKPGFNAYKWVPLRVPNGTIKDSAGNAIIDHNVPSSYSTQSFLTPHWGSVAPFALSSGHQFRPPAPPVPGSSEPYTDGRGNVTTNDAAYHSQLDEVLQISTNLSDRDKVIAEYWADGPRSETPPGHWNALAHGISERDRHNIDQDVKLYFALNCAVYDSGIAAWDAKRAHDFIRPVSAIRNKYYNQTIQAWGGPNRGTVEMLGQDWRPYQSLTFVTPPFPEYVSGHSTFSASAAAVLTNFTGSNVFYDGVTRLNEDFNRDGVADLLGQHIIGKGGNGFEASPSSVVVLQWPTFQDAADEAGISRLYGGIHFQDGDRFGRAMGTQIGNQAYAKAEALWNGTAE